MNLLKISPPYVQKYVQPAVQPELHAEVALEKSEGTADQASFQICIRCFQNMCIYCVVFENFLGERPSVVRKLKDKRDAGCIFYSRDLNVVELSYMSQRQECVNCHGKEFVSMNVVGQVVGVSKWGSLWDS